VAAAFRVEIDDEARPLLARWLADFDLLRPCILIERAGPVGDVARDADGKAVWSVYRPRFWSVSIGAAPDGPPHTGLLDVDGFQVRVPHDPGPGERTLRIGVLDGRLQVKVLP